MAKPKSSKRKAAASLSKQTKIAKTTQLQTLSPPATDTDAPLEPKHLSSLISPEELSITIETLESLAQYPSLIKSKQCKDLRVATYDFRTACTTGLNTAAEGNLTARVSAALVDGKYLEARILLAEMRIRGETPKIGAICRWVRDLDVVSGLSGVKGVHGRGVRSEEEREGLRVLDAVLRVAGPVDEASPVAKEGEMISVQQTWDLRGSEYTPMPVCAMVADGSLVGDKEAVKSKYTILETTPGPQRKPPNHHPAILFTSSPNAVDLAVPGPERTLHHHPIVPNLSLIKNVLSPAECTAIIAAGEATQFIPDTPIRSDGGEESVLAHNFYWIIDTAFHDKLWERVRSYVPASCDGRVARGLNRRFRVYRYVPGAEYRCHIDGAWPPSGISPKGEYQYDSSPPEKRQSSLYTFLIYLNDDFEGGETTYFLPGVKEGTLNAYPLKPVQGAVAVFPHGERRGAPLHEGTGVRRGAKYVVRTDVEYDVEPTVEEK